MARKERSSKQIFWQNICLVLSVVFFLFNIKSLKAEETKPSVSVPTPAEPVEPGQPTIAEGQAKADINQRVADFTNGILALKQAQGKELLLTAEDVKLIKDYRQRLLTEISQPEVHLPVGQPIVKNTYTVKMYDTLWRIAKKELGDPLRWEEIYNANKAIIGNRPILRLGQVLVMPLDKRSPAVSLPPNGVEGSTTTKTPAEETRPTTSEPEQLKIVPITEAEQMKKLHSPADYIAFSLNAAQRLIQEAGEKNYRAIYPEVFNLGGINQIVGLVYDQKTGDVIFVGKYVLSHPPLTLDDFKVCLNSRFIYGKWPVVSIDPTNETPKTGMQLVRYEGGIENTAAGNDLVCGDYELKLMGMDILHPGISDLKTYWVLNIEEINSGQRKGTFKIDGRFWFFPIIPRIVIREGVAEIKGLKVGVFTEVLSAEFDGKPVENLASFRDIVGDTFAESISKRFEELAKIHLSFARIQGLEEMVGLVHALQNLEEKPDLNYWLKDYPLRKVETKKEIRVLKRQYIHPGGTYELSGGVQLNALAIRLKQGDVRALKEAVLLTRPKQDTLYWSFVIGEWVIPTPPGMINIEQVPQLFTHALFLQNNKRYDEAISLYTQIIQLQPDLVNAYINRGVAYTELGQFNQALADFNKALEINPRDADAYNNRGNTYYRLDQYSQAMADFNKALEINPRYAEAYYNRGVVYNKLRQYSQAIADYNKALEIYPTFAVAYFNKALTCERAGRTKEAIEAYQSFIQYASSQYRTQIEHAQKRIKELSQ